MHDPNNLTEVEQNNLSYLLRKNRYTADLLPFILRLLFDSPDPCKYISMSEEDDDAGIAGEY